MPNPKQNAPKSMRKAVVEDTLLMKVVQKYFKLAGAVSVVWLVGYFKFSVSWLWLLLVVYVWKDRNTKAKQHKTAISQEIARDEKSVILARVEDLPSWVNFPDVERAEWMNKILDQMWPYIGEFVEKILRESVEPSVKNSLPASFKSFKFSTIDLGDIPPRIGGVKVYTQLRRDEIYMDLEINYSSDCNIAVSIKGINAGIKDFRLHGTLRVVFKPLINKSPLIGGMLVFFLNNPDIDFNLTSLANAFDLPGLSDMLHSIIQEQIANFMVLPNRYPIQLAEGLDINKLRYPQPQGVVRVKVLEAKDLLKSDISLTGKGKSDPYVVLKVGAKEVKTRIINNTVQPVWNETFEMIVDSADGQLLYLDVFDDDPGSKDDELGRVNMDLSQLKEVGFEDEWLPLEDVKQGMIHLQLTWLWLANDPLELDRTVPEAREESDHEVCPPPKVLSSNVQNTTTETVPKAREQNDHGVCPLPKEITSNVQNTTTEMLEQVMQDQKTVEENKTHVAMLLVFLDSAMNLPRGKKSLQEPSPQAVLSVGQQEMESSIRQNTNEPRWEESFRFLLHNPNYQNLEVEIKDTKAKKAIGATVVKLKELLVAEDMVMDQKFHIKTSEGDSYVNMRLALRILTPTANPEWMGEEDSLIEETAKEGEAGTSVDSKSEQHAATSAANGSSVDKTRNNSTPTGVAGSSGNSAGGDEAGAVSETMDSKQAPAAEESGLRQRNVVKNDAGEYGIGRIQMTFRYSQGRERLVIVVHKCCSLRPVEGDSKNLADPYVRMYLLPEKSSSSKRKTKVVKDDLNPVFDETFEYSVSETELARRTLEVTVKNEVGMFSSSKTFMGTLLLDLSTLDVSRAVTNWFDLALEHEVKSSSFESDV